MEILKTDDQWLPKELVSGVLHKAKMIGSLSVKFHKGDKMAIDAMRDLQVMAKSSERHKARILLRITVQGIHILEAGSMKQIDVHDIDKISYLAEDPDNKKVFCYYSSYCKLILKITNLWHWTCSESI